MVVKSTYRAGSAKHSHDSPLLVWACWVSQLGFLSRRGLAPLVKAELQGADRPWDAWALLEFP